jgi:hypothetical protein
MITAVVFKRFKQFKDRRIELGAAGLKLLAGGNNSGKTSLFQGLVIWEFCKTLVEAEKGRAALSPGEKTLGVGVSDHEFVPINVPDLRHLWTNLKTQKVPGEEEDGYTLRIRCEWRESDQERHLEFGLSLANDRLFVRATSTDVAPEERIPRVAYLPPFAGISARESRVPLAVRRRRVGEGLAGAVLRNSLLDLFLQNEKRRKELRGDKSKISDADLKQLRNSDPWELVQSALRQVFGAELDVSPFNDAYHSYINVEIVKGAAVSEHKLKRYKGYNARDLMVEGSGLLQWLSVFSLAADPSYDLLLLDEPDAHLHVTLQRALLEQLEKVAPSKLILVATHSSEVLRLSKPSSIIGFKANTAPAFLATEEDKVALIAGVGSIYMPKLDAVRESGKILFVEGGSDAEVLRVVATTLGWSWPEGWVVWIDKTHHEDRIKLSRALRQEVAGLQVVSIRDRDLESSNSVDLDVLRKGLVNDPAEFKPVTWKRRNIENYLLHPSTLSQAGGGNESSVSEALADNFGIAVGQTFTDHDAPQGILDVDGKAVLASLGVNKIKAAKALAADLVAEDLKTVLRHLGCVPST